MKKKKKIEIEVNPWMVTTIVLGLIVIIGIAYFAGLTSSGKATAVVEQGEKTRAENPTATDFVEDNDPGMGNKNARVVILDYDDFQCPFCKKFYDETFELIKKNYIETGKVYYVFKQFPLSSIHQYARKAAEASLCAQDQGRFWEYHDILFIKQTEWSLQGTKKFLDYAEELGLEKKEFEECLSSGKYFEEVEKEYDQAAFIGATGTPSFVINDVLVPGAQPYEVFQQVIDQKLSE